jgi:hypothetical protein
LEVVAEQLGQVDTKIVERYYGHLASGHIAQTFRALPGVGLDKAGKGKRQLQRNISLAILLHISMALDTTVEGVLNGITVGKTQAGTQSENMAAGGDDPNSSFIAAGMVPFVYHLAANANTSRKTKTSP